MTLTDAQARAAVLSINNAKAFALAASLEDLQTVTIAGKDYPTADVREFGNRYLLKRDDFHHDHFANVLNDLAKRRLSPQFVLGACVNFFGPVANGIISADSENYYQNPAEIVKIGRNLLKAIVSEPGKYGNFSDEQVSEFREIFVEAQAYYDNSSRGSIRPSGVEPKGPL